MYVARKLMFLNLILLGYIIVIDATHFYKRTKGVDSHAHLGIKGMVPIDRDFLDGVMKLLSEKNDLGIIAPSVNL